MARKIPSEKVARAYYSLKPSDRTMLNTAKALYNIYHINITRKTVWNNLKDYGINTSIKKIKIPDEEIVHRYVNLGEKVKQIAKELHKDSKLIGKILKRNGVEFKPEKYLPVEEIVKLYETKSFKAIADIYHVGDHRIRNLLESAGIEIKQRQIPLTPFEKLMYNNGVRQMPEEEYKAAVHDLGVVMVCFRDFGNYFRKANKAFT